jgi:hypothetical protein
MPSDFFCDILINSLHPEVNFDAFNEFVNRRETSVLPARHKHKEDPLKIGKGMLV